MMINNMKLMIMLMIMDHDYSDIGYEWYIFILVFKSLIKYIYRHQFWPFPTEPSLVKGDGDGTVNIRSLKVILL